MNRAHRANLVTIFQVLVACCAIGLGFGFVRESIAQEQAIPALRLVPAVRAQPAVPTGEAIDGAAPEVPKEIAKAADSGRLRLKNGDYVDGSLVSGNSPDRIFWKNHALNEPIEFEVSAIRSIDSPVPEESTAVDGHYSVVMHSGDRFWGNIESWGADKVLLSTKSFGPMELKSDWIKQVYRWEQTPGVLFHGPRSMDDWTILDHSMKWSLESGSLITTENGAKIRGKVGLTDRVQIDLRISWSRQPNFLMAFGVGNEQTKADHAFSIEVWDDRLALVRDVGAKADAAYLERLNPKQAFVELTIFLDQVAGRAVVYSERGNQLADISLPAPDAKSQPCVLFENFGRELRLDQIRIQNWTTQLPAVRSGEPNFAVDRDGTTYSGKIASFDSSQGWTLRGSDGQEKTIPADRLMEVVQSTPPALDTPPSPTAQSAAAESPSAESPSAESPAAESPAAESPKTDSSKASGPSDVASSTASPTAADGGAGTTSKPDVVTLLLHDQSRSLGKWLATRDGKISFQPECAWTPVDIPITALAALRGNAVEFTAPKKEDTREGQLLLKGLQLAGSFADGQGQGEVTCLGWKPKMASNVVHLTRQAEGRIEFRKPDLRTNVAASQGNVRVLGGRQAPTAVPPPTVRKPTVPNIALRSGDLILAELAKIDEHGVTFKSASTPTTFVPHDQIQSVELKRPRRDRAQAAHKMARLLTVPRSKKLDPPTHLVASTDGDFLRGRLVSLADGMATIEVRLEEVKVPIEKIAQIIWLHDRQWDDKKNGVSDPSIQVQADVPAASQKEKAEPGFLVHAVERSGWKLTFDPQSLQGDSLSGTSLLLGQCSVMLKNLDFMLVGPKISERARELTSNPWALTLAKLPQVYLDAEAEESGTSNMGTASSLVGKPAPKLEAEGLDGTMFKLSEQKGRVIVLDFWASWCGPCMQTMPAIDSVVRELNSKELDLVAVNLEEPADRAQAAMERLKLDTKVVLDLDGVAAQRYQANAIPQTVIVDRQGVVRYVFVGGGSKVIEQFRSSLQKVLEEPGTPAQ